jgi:hypothetical protein
MVTFARSRKSQVLCFAVVVGSDLVRCGCRIGRKCKIRYIYRMKIQDRVLRPALHSIFARRPERAWARSMTDGGGAARWLDVGWFCLRGGLMWRMASVTSVDPIRALELFIDWVRIRK